tara:strand:+ start:27379 stop:28317 length:939 start_codon:yes stop_codon:yes gene_type:complete
MKILVTGGTGMVGSAFKKLKVDHQIVLLGSTDYDLTDPGQTKGMLIDHNPDALIHLAAKVGGVKGNSDYVSDFFYENIMMNTNVLESARMHRVPKVLSLLSTCIYPDNSTYPLTEDQIHSGEPHQSNYGYAYAKRMLEVQSRAIRQQYGLNYITAIPNNIYGQKDNFNLNNGHVIPALIRKIHEAKSSGKVPRFWGSGRAVREFTYSDDVAHILIWLLENYDSEKTINIGNPEDITIYNLVLKIQNIMDAKQTSDWDDLMPEGQLKKPSSNKRFMNLYKNDLNKAFAYTPLDSGLEKTISWFLKEYPNVRGM